MLPDHLLANFFSFVMAARIDGGACFEQLFVKLGGRVAQLAAHRQGVVHGS
jgi:hypothetical protein